MSIDYRPPKTINQFLRSEAMVTVLMGPLGSGKSTGCAMKIARQAKAQAPGRDGKRRTRWAVIRNTKQQLRDTTLKTWLEWFPDGIAGTWRASDMTFILEFEDVYAEVLFRALDTPDDQKQLLSLELTGAWINEAREIHGDIVQALMTRTGRYPSKKEGGPSWYGMFCDTNPPAKESWWHQMMEVSTPPNWEVFKQPGGMSPEAENRENLPATYYEEMIAMATESGRSKEWINVHVNAQYGRSNNGRPVYEETWVPDFHIAKDPLNPITSLPLIIGMDFGRTPAAALMQLDPMGRTNLIDELTSENMGLDTFIKRKLRPMLAGRYVGMRYVVCGDPAGWAKSQINDLSCADVLRLAGFRAVKAPTNDPDKRIQAVERKLALQIGGGPGFLVSPTCKATIRGFDFGYKFRMRQNGSYESTPDKQSSSSHIHDAVQYGVLGVEGGIDSMGARAMLEEEFATDTMRGWT